MGSLVLRRLCAFVLVVSAGGAGFLVWQRHQTAALMPGFAVGNGRLEATEVDVASKVAGRLTAVRVQEGDDVAPGQVLAELDADDLQARLRAAEAQVRQTRSATQQSRAALASALSQQSLAQMTYARTAELVKRGFVTGDRLDRDRSAVHTTTAAVEAARGGVSEAAAAVATAEAAAEVLRVTLRDAVLKAPVAGRVLYRLAEPGEVLVAGGKVLTLLDLADVFISIYLPAAEAGKVGVGSPARVVLDALADQPIAARVVFVAPRAQFTPKEVETRNEREKLMFRVKVRVEPVWLAAHAALAKPGMPGVAYVQTDPRAAWPAALAGQ